MDTTLIEQTGINSLKNFILQTKTIIPHFNEMDKYPIWDGELLVYNDDNIIADNLSVRVPVQVKSELKIGKKKDIEKYSVKVSYLTKYADEGGVLFFKVVVDDENGVCYYYAKLLLKADIILLLENLTENQKTKTIDLKEIVLPSQVFTMCLNYKFHRPLQMHISTGIKLDKIMTADQIYTYGYIDNIEDLVNNEQYAYVKVDDDLLNYVGIIKNSVLYERKYVPVYTTTKKFYNYITEVIKENEHYFEINENAIIDTNNKLVLHSFPKKELSLDRAINNLEFVQDLYKTRKIKIGNSKYVSLSCEDIDKKELQYNIENVENNLKYLYCAKNTFDILHIPVNMVTIQDMIDIENEVCRIRDVIKNREKLYFDDDKNDTFILVEQLKNITYLIYFVKQEDGSYIGYDYLNDSEILTHLKMEIDGDVVQLSRYYSLNAETIVGLCINENSLLDELKMCTKNEMTVTFINYLMMEFIKAYDLNQDSKYLNIATKINKLLRKQRDFYSEELYKINNYQIMKRKTGRISKEEEKKILTTKVKTHDTPIKLACCLLLEQYDEFIILLDELNDEDRAVFKKWAIFNLLPDMYKESVL